VKISASYIQPFWSCSLKSENLDSTAKKTPSKNKGTCSIRDVPTTSFHKLKTEENLHLEMIMVRLPYLGALSSQIEKIEPFLKRQTSGRVKLRVIN